MSKKEEKKAQFELVQTLAPLPLTTRSYALHLGSGNTDWIAYGNGRLVVLRNLKDPSISDCSFTEHKGNVTVAKISPSGGWVCSGDDQGTVIVWGLKNKIVKQTLQINKKIYDIDWAPDSTKIVAVGDGAESKSKVFPFDSGNSLGVVEQHAKPILSVSYKAARPFKIATTSEDHTSNFYEGPPFKFVRQNDEPNTSNCVRFSPDGSYYMTVGAEMTLYDGKEGKVVKSYKDEKEGHKGTILSISWSSDGTKFLTTGMDKTAKMWSFKAGDIACTSTFDFGGKGTDYTAQQVSALWYGSYTISVSLTGAINYLTENKPDQTHSVFGVQQPFTGWSFNSSTGLLYTADSSGHLTTWDPSKGTAKWWSNTNAHAKIVVGCAVNAKGSHLWTISHDNTIKYNDLKENVFSSGGAALGAGPVAVAAAHKDAGLAAVILSDKLLIIREEKIVNSVESKVNCLSLCWSPDDTHVAVGCTDGKIRVYEVDKDSAKLSVTHEGQHIGKIVAVSYTPEGKLISMGFDRSFYFWEDKEKVLNRTGWPHHNASVVSCAFSSDGLFATASQDQNIIIWRDMKGMDDTKRTKIELAHLEGVLFICFLKGDLLLSLGADKTIKTWKV